MPAQIEKLLAHQIRIGDHNGIQRPRASLPLDARGQHMIAFIRIVRRVLIDRQPEHAALYQIVPTHHAGIRAGRQQRHKRRTTLALQHARVEQHHLLQSRRDGIFLVETFPHEDHFLRNAA